MRPRPRLLLLPLILAGLAGVRGAPALADDSADEIFALARSDYVENCGGCHGIEGTSAPAKIPVLRDRIGYFLCNPQARAYLIHVPNVAHSRLTDNAQLAELMNFAVFGFGGASVPAGAVRFTGEEIARERVHALSKESLIGVRKALVDKLVKTCKAPASLRLFYPGQPAGQRN